MRSEPPPSLPWATGQHAARDGRGRAAGGAAGRAVGVPRVAGRAGVARLGGRQDPELGHVGDADDHEARLLQPPHEVRAVAGPVVAEELRPEVHASCPATGRVGLDRDRHAGERPLVAGLDRVGGRERAARASTSTNALSFGVALLDALERRVTTSRARSSPPRTWAASSPTVMDMRSLIRAGQPRAPEARQNSTFPVDRTCRVTG